MPINLPPELEESIRKAKQDKKNGIKPTINEPLTKLIQPNQETNKPPANLEPIKLIHKYIGNCPKCGHPVETIELSITNKKNKVRIVCWCNTCHKQLEDKEVFKIN
jgi:hypothetical protein